MNGENFKRDRATQCKRREGLFKANVVNEEEEEEEEEEEDEEEEGLGGPRT